MFEKVVSFDVKGPNGRRRSQNNFNHEFQAKIPAEMTVVEKFKMAAMCTVCIIS